MIRAFRKLHNLYGVLNAGQDELERSTGVPACISGCGKCCEQNTPMCMTIEALNMVSVLHGKLSQIAAIAEGWLLEKRLDLKIYKGMPLGLLSQDLLAETKLISKGQCPFLMGNKTCLIHSARPVTCRTFGVYRESFEMNCPRPVGKGETLTQHAIIRPEIARGMLREYQAECEHRNPSWIIRGFVPTLFFRAYNPAKLKAYVADNKIASAKLVGINLDIDLTFQYQVDKLRQGISPMQVICEELTGTGAR